jgi:hypothetical protein
MPNHAEVRICKTYTQGGKGVGLVRDKREMKLENVEA